jgi:hypothetical protein
MLQDGCGFAMNLFPKPLRQRRAYHQDILTMRESFRQPGKCLRETLHHCKPATWEHSIYNLLTGSCLDDPGKNDLLSASTCLVLRR